MEYHDENTMHKVRWAFNQHIISQRMIDDVINTVLNAGIVFRERMDIDEEGRGEPPVEPDVVPVEEFPLVDTNQFIRIQCLDFATRDTINLSATRSTTKQQIEKARYFEQYIKNGAFENA